MKTLHIYKANRRDEIAVDSFEIHPGWFSDAEGAAVFKTLAPSDAWANPQELLQSLTEYQIRAKVYAHSNYSNIDLPMASDVVMKTLQIYSNTRAWELGRDRVSIFHGWSAFYANAEDAAIVNALPPTSTWLYFPQEFLDAMTDSRIPVVIHAHSGATYTNVELVKALLLAKPGYNTSSSTKEQQ